MWICQQQVDDGTPNTGQLYARKMVFNNKSGEVVGSFTSATKLKADEVVCRLMNTLIAVWDHVHGLYAYDST